MKMDIEYPNELMDLTKPFQPEPPRKMEGFIVTINGEVCPPEIRNVIIMGMALKPGLTGVVFSEVVREYLGRR